MKDENVFIDLATTYTNYIKKVIHLAKFNGLTTHKPFSLFGRNNWDSESNDIAEKYLDMKKFIDDNKMASFYLFAKYIRFAEKCFMYKNDVSSHVYSEDIKENTNLYFDFTDYKIKISFEKSHVPLLEDPIFSGLIDDGENNVMFIKIEIVREFGKRMKNEFKFITDPKFSDDSDRILYNTIIAKCTREIEYTNDKILNSIIPIYTGIYDDCLLERSLDWRYVKNYGLYTR